jgi:hypothetical protein
MPVIVVTRLRLRDPALFDEFVGAAFAVVQQAQSSDGNLASDLLADADNVYWTSTAWRTAWRDRDAMNAFVGTEPHLSTMPRIDDWCDEATFVDWDQPSADLPGWQTRYERLVADGQVTKLSNSSDAHETRDFPAPVESP